MSLRPRSAPPGARFGNGLLGRSDCAAILKKNLDEEEAADNKLTAMAESRINLQAAE